MIDVLIACVVGVALFLIVVTVLALLDVREAWRNGDVPEPIEDD